MNLEYQTEKDISFLSKSKSLVNYFQIKFENSLKERSQKACYKMVSSNL